MNVKISFDGEPEVGVIDFGVGQPSADLLPLQRVRAASERFFAHAQAIELNYGDKQGDPRFRAALGNFLNQAGGHAASAERRAFGSRKGAGKPASVRAANSRREQRISTPRLAVQPAFAKATARPPKL